MNVDVAVIGLGAMGSAGCAALAGRGARIVGLERFQFGDDRGSSTGKTRIIRKAYFEDPAYVPLLERAYEGWRALEQRTGSQLLDLYGVLMAGRPDSNAVRGVERSARAFDIPVERYDSRELRRKFPGCAPRADEVGIFEPAAGVVFPERANAAHLAVARAAGAELLDRSPVTAIDPQPASIVLHLGDGTRVNAARVIVTAGAWTSRLLRDLGLPLRVERNVQWWFRSNPSCFTPQTMPAFFVERDDAPYPFYGMPDTGDGVKFAFHGSGIIADPETIDREAHGAELEQARSMLESWLPGAAGECAAAKVCMYTLTPDGNFAIGAHPHDARITIACGFSGHGYKFAPVIGEIIAGFAMNCRPSFDLAFLSLERLL